MTNCVTKIIIADDHHLVREGFVAFFNKQPGMEVVAEARNGRELLQCAETKDVDIIITDIEMPVMNGPQAIRVLAEKMPHIPCLAISFSDDPLYIHKITQAGAKGYCIKSSELRELIEAIQLITAGGIFYCSETRPIMRRFERELEAAGKYAKKLTAAEEEILRLTCEDLTAKEIAGKVGLAVNTVRDYSKKIKQKTGTKSISGMAVYAIKHFIYLLKR